MLRIKMRRASYTDYVTFTRSPEGVVCNLGCNQIANARTHFLQAYDHKTTSSVT